MSIGNLIEQQGEKAQGCFPFRLEGSKRKAGNLVLLSPVTIGTESRLRKSFPGPLQRRPWLPPGPCSRIRSRLRRRRGSPHRDVTLNGPMGAAEGGAFVFYKSKRGQQPRLHCSLPTFPRERELLLCIYVPCVLLSTHAHRETSR